jgi:hypothetical protein
VLKLEIIGLRYLILPLQLNIWLLPVVAVPVNMLVRAEVLVV